MDRVYWVWIGGDLKRVVLPEKVLPAFNYAVKDAILTGKGLTLHEAGASYVKAT